jgi:hypothetical protein
MANKQLYQLTETSITSDDDIYHLQTAGLEDKHIKKSDLLGNLLPVVRKGKLGSPLVHLFANNKFVKRLKGSLSFTRDSTATYVDRYGIVRTAEIDEPREEENGWLIEGESTNLLLHSEDFSQSAWVLQKNGAGDYPTIDATDGVAPDGTSTATTITFNTNAGTNTTDLSMLRQDVTTIASEDYTSSVFVKGVSGEQVLLRGAAHTVYTLITFTGEWQRIETTETAASISEGIEFGLRQSVSGHGVINSSVTFSVWGAQCEQLPIATSYIPTSATTVTRPAEILTIKVQDNFLSINEGDHSHRFTFKSLGGIENPQYIVSSKENLSPEDNLLTNPNTFNGAGWNNLSSGTGVNPVISATDALAPDGTNTATTITFDTGVGVASGDYSQKFQNVGGLTVGNEYTSSMYVKGTKGEQLLLRGAGNSLYKLITLTGFWQHITTTEEATATTRGIMFGLRQSQVPEPLNSSVTVDIWTADFRLGEGAPDTFSTYLDPATSLLNYRDGSTDPEASIEFDYTDTLNTVCVTKDGAIVVYLNGVSSGGPQYIASTSELDISSQVFIGNDVFKDKPVYGHIKDFKIYDFALTETEVKFLEG